MRSTPFATIAELDAYTASERIQCLECGRWFRSLATHLPRVHGMRHQDYREKWGIPRRYALAGTATRALLSDQMHDMITAGTLTHEHLPVATAAARDAGRRSKTPADAERHRQTIAALRPGDHSRLPAGSRRANGRDADRARNYQIAYRALKNGDPEPMRIYRERCVAKHKLAR